MKLKEALYFLGFKPKPKSYGFKIKNFELPADGSISYAQWLHPKESEKTIEQDAVVELRKFLAPGDAALDIGAHTGDTAIPLALAVGKTGCVFALEPNPYVFPVLEKNAELNADKTNIVALMFAATESDGEFEFAYSDAGFCNGGFHAGESVLRHAHAFKLKVAGKNLLNYLRENHSEFIPKIRFVKVDAEGFDFAILKTLEDLIARNKPFIKAEVYKTTTLGERERFYEFLIKHDYEIFHVEGEDNYCGRLIKKENLNDWKHYDIFCVPADFLDNE